jgi:hypothetical protein
LQTDYPDRSERCGDDQTDQKAFNKKGDLQSSIQNSLIGLTWNYYCGKFALE